MPSHEQVQLLSLLLLNVQSSMCFCVKASQARPSSSPNEKLKTLSEIKSLVSLHNQKNMPYPHTKKYANQTMDYRVSLNCHDLNLRLDRKCDCKQMQLKL